MASTKLKVTPCAALAGVALLTLALGLGCSRAGDRGLRLYGNVDIREVTLAFRVSGRVSAMALDEGETAKAGDLLAELDPGPYGDQLAQAEAELAIRMARLELVEAGYREDNIGEARARLAEAQAALRYADLMLERERQLRAGDASTEQKLDEARTRRDQAAAAVDLAGSSLHLLEAGYRPEEIAQARAELQLAEARVEEARRRVGDCRLYAPSPGTVRTRVLEPGAIAAAGAPVYVLSVDERPWVRAYIDEGLLGRISPGMRVEVHTDSRPGKPYAGHVGFISPTAEFTPKTVQTESLRTNLVYRFRVVVEEPDDALRQGMPVTVVVPDAAD